MGLGEKDTDASARRCASKGVADVGDTLLGNFLQGVSNVAREEPDKKQRSSRERKNGEQRQEEKTESRHKGKEKRRRSRERLEGQTGSNKSQNKDVSEKHRKKASKHSKASHDKMEAVNGHASQQKSLNSDAKQSMPTDRRATRSVSQQNDADASSRVDSVFELAVEGRDKSIVVKRPGPNDAPESQPRNGCFLHKAREAVDEKASRRRDRKRRRKKDEGAREETNADHAQNAQGFMDEAAAITDDTADDILGSFLRKLLGGSSQSEPEKAPSTASAAAAVTSTSTPSRVSSPPAPVSTALPEVGDLLGGSWKIPTSSCEPSRGAAGSEEEQESLVATESGSESLEHDGNGVPGGGKQEQLSTPLVVESVNVQVAEDLEAKAPAVASTVPAATVAHAEALPAVSQTSVPATAPGQVMESDDSSDSYSSSSSSASLRRRAQLVASSQAPQVASAQTRSLDIDSSSSSSSSSDASSVSHFSELFACESVPATAAVPNDRGPSRVARLACAKMGVRAKLRCSCHFALLRSCPDKGDEAVGDEFCGSDG